LSIFWSVVFFSSAICSAMTVSPENHT